MTTNGLIAIANVVKNPVVYLVERYRSVNRANSMGDALEYYIKDLFCGTLGEKDENKRNKIYSGHFSYIGNQNNPPDAMIRGGDAIEIKKVESMHSGIALNSSYPKDKLHADSPMITRACRESEDWREKDVVYAV